MTRLFPLPNAGWQQFTFLFHSTRLHRPISAVPEPGFSMSPRAGPKTRKNKKPAMNHGGLKEVGRSPTPQRRGPLISATCAFCGGSP
jgi:hypothetical protein